MSCSVEASRSNNRRNVNVRKITRARTKQACANEPQLLVKSVGHVNENATAISLPAVDVVNDCLNVYTQAKLKLGSGTRSEDCH